MTNPVTFETHGAIGVLRIDNPPVNAISPKVLAGLIEGLAAFESQPALGALLVHCAGRTFVAGGDINAFDLPDFNIAPFNNFLARLEQSTRPVVAALHGTVLGGGLELAMACHYRLALPGTRVGLPEIKLGLVPGSLGTQRLPRLAGISLALDLIQSGRMLETELARASGIIDVVHEGEALASGLAYARSLLAAGASARRSSEQPVSLDGIAADFFAAALSAALKKPAYPALAAAVRCVQAATLPFAQGAQVEAREFEALRPSPSSRALRHLFFAQRLAGQVPGLPKETAARKIFSVGVVGAEAVGADIATMLANAGLPVVLVDGADEALQHGLELARNHASAAKGRLSVALLTGSPDYAALADCDLVILAAAGKQDRLREIGAKLAQICKPGAIMATSSSTLAVEDLAQVCGRPADVVGLHFFKPPQVTRVLEIARGAQTAPAVLATVMKLAAAVGKVAVVSNGGLIGPRMAEVYLRLADALLLEGARPERIDQAAEALGMAMGPCRMRDTMGAPRRGPARQIDDGQHRDIPDQEIIERLFYPVINEGARILAEGIACRASDIDMIWVAGYGFPDHRGGPMFMADEIGLPAIAAGLAARSPEGGDVPEHRQASRLLQELAAQGKRLSRASCDV